MEIAHSLDLSTWQNPTASQVGTAFFGLIFAIILWFACFRLADDKITGWFNLIVCLLGVALGWLVGTALSPYDTIEHSVFSTVAKTVSLFVSGYLISKLDQPLNAVIGKFTSSINSNPDGLNAYKPSRINAFRVIAFAVSLVCASIVVYSSRAYDQQRIKQAAAKSIPSAKVDSVVKAKVDSVFKKVSFKQDSLLKRNKELAKNLDSLKRTNR